METIRYIAESVLLPFIMPFVPNQRIYWLYLLGAAILAFLVYRHLPKKSSFLSFLFPKDVYGNASSKLDFRYFFINRIFFFMILTHILLGASHVSNFIEGRLLAVWDGPGWQWNALWLKMTIYTIISVLLFDFGIFFAHYLQHKVPIFWQFHKVHHSAEVLNPLTLYRAHPVDDILSSFFAALFTGTFSGVYLFAFGEPGMAYKVGGVNVVLFLYYVFGYNLRHSHVWISYGPILSRILISPAQHQIHHSRFVEHHDRNFGLIFSFWDGLFGSLVVPDKKLNIEYGLTNQEEKEFSSIGKLYFLPFKKCFDLFKPRKATRS